MSAMNDASDNNGSEGQADGVAYATFGANAGVDQVIVMAKTRVIMAYADPCGDARLRPRRVSIDIVCSF
jgi:hypothetical protein